MKGDRETKLDNQTSSHFVMRGTRNRAHKSSDVSPILNRRSTSSLEDDNTNNISTSIDSEYSYQSIRADKLLLNSFDSQPSQQMLIASPVRKRRPSTGSPHRSTKNQCKNQRYSEKRRSLPVIFEHDDAILSTSFLSPSPHRKPQNKYFKLQKRPSSVSDADIGAIFAGARRKESIFLDRHALKKHVPTLIDGFTTSNDILSAIPDIPYASRRTPEVYSVVPRKSHLPRYGFIIHRNPYTHLPRNRHILPNVTITGYPHQVRRQSTNSLDEINRRITQTNLERKESNVQSSVVENSILRPDIERRDSLTNRSDGNKSLSQVGHSSSSESRSSSSESDSSSSEWTTDDSDSISESDSESDTDSSYTTTTSSSTSSSSDSDNSSSDGSSSDSDSSVGEESSKSSTSRNTFVTDDSSDMTESSRATSSAVTKSSSDIASSVSTDFTRTSTESSDSTRSSSRSSRTLSRSLSVNSCRTLEYGCSISTYVTSKLRSVSRSSSIRSCSSSPIKSKKSSLSSSRTSSSLESSPDRRMSTNSDLCHSSTTGSGKSWLLRRNSSKKCRTRRDEKRRTTFGKSGEKGKQKSNEYMSKANEHILSIASDDVPVTSTPVVIVHKGTEHRLELPSSNVSAACVIL